MPRNKYLQSECERMHSLQRNQTVKGDESWHYNHSLPLVWKNTSIHIQKTVMVV